MIIADNSLLVLSLLTGQRTAQAEAVLEKDPVWAMPILWRSDSEIRSLAL